jgi:hypothetical protein
MSFKYFTIYHHTTHCNKLHARFGYHDQLLRASRYHHSRFSHKLKNLMQLCFPTSTRTQSLSITKPQLCFRFRRRQSTDRHQPSSGPWRVHDSQLKTLIGHQRYRKTTTRTETRAYSNTVMLESNNHNINPHSYSSYKDYCNPLPQCLHHLRPPPPTPRSHRPQRRTPRHQAPNAQYRHQPAIPHALDRRIRHHGTRETENISHKVVQRDAALLGMNSVNMVFTSAKINMDPTPKKKFATMGTAM